MIPQANKFKALNELIGKTPLAEITLDYKGNIGKVYVKLESYNYTGSIKDRIALHMLEEAYRTGALKEGDKIAEGTSGNTGIALAALGSFLGHETVIFMPDWMTKERMALIEGFGANVRQISKEEGGFNALSRYCDDFSREGGVFLTRQFENMDNARAHYLSTGKEIIEQMYRLNNLTPDAIVAGVGTGGTIVGIAKRLKEKNPNLKVFPLEPDNSLSMSGGAQNENHFIYGIGDGFIPDIVKNYTFDEVMTANQHDSVIMAQKLAKTLGLGVGISSGANLIGAVKVLDKIGFKKNVVTVFADDNKKYLTSEYIRKFSPEDYHLSKDINLLDLSIIR